MYAIRSYYGIAGALDQIRIAAGGAHIDSRRAEELSHMFFGPSVASRVNTGMKLTVITNSEKKMLGPTSCIASMMTDWRLACRPVASQSGVDVREKRMPDRSDTSRSRSAAMP